jgi:hypothetical protein
VNLAVTGVDHQPFVIRLINQSLKQKFPHTLVASATKSPVRLLPVPIVWRQIAPWRACAQNPEHCIDKKPIVMSHTAPLPGLTRK